MKVFLTQLRSALNVLDLPLDVRFVNVATAFSLRNVETAPNAFTVFLNARWRAVFPLDVE